MLFSSLEFLFLFLPLSIAGYFCLPMKFRNFWLLLSGICFYAFGEPKYLPVMLLVIITDFVFGLVISAAGSKPKLSRVLLVTAVICNVGILAYFKFFASELPIGISFYSFQALSYVIDVYRKNVSVCRNPINFGAYVSLYPQLVAGPIVRYSDVDVALKNRKHSVSAVADGLRTFVAGLSKKVLLANTAGEMWSSFSGRDGFVDACAGIFFFAAQIYFDFSGYSDMALGLGRVFGFDFPQNFNYPYVSKSITDFWRRWHITLSSFFREYVYIPLGGNRKGRARTFINLFITWMLTGIWHGASPNFLLWGVYFAFILILEKAFLLRLLSKLPTILRRLYSLLLVAIGWVIFASDGESLTLAEGGAYILRLFGIGCGSFCPPLTQYELLRNLVFVAILAFGATGLPKRVYRKLCTRAPVAGNVLNVILPIAFFILSVAYIVNSGYNPFLYFRF